MGHSYISAHVHCVFSTKDRKRQLTEDLQSRLWAFLGGIARENGMRALIAGGTEDHAHILLSLPATMAVAKAIQLIKGGSSKWIHDTFPQHGGFRWQEGYGAFSIGISQIERTVTYIRSQKEHHRTKTFQEEFVGFLKKHGIGYDDRYLWD